MVKDFKRIAPPNNCISPSTFEIVKPVKHLVNDKGLRHDGRKIEDLRPIVLKVGMAPFVTGSAYLECGNTKVIASVNGPRDVLHKSDSSTKGVVFCELKYAMFSCKQRQPYVPTDEELGISKTIQDALEPVILLHKYPKARIDVSILILENDGGAINAAITCAGAALSNAGVEMFALPIGCSLVFTGEHILMDPTGLEESYQISPEFVKITVGMMPEYNRQVIYMNSVGCLKQPLLSQALKTLHHNCHIILTHISECLKLQLKSSSESSENELNDAEKIADKELKLFQPQLYMNAHLEYDIRPDERELNDFRPVLITLGSIGTAYGSALIRCNNTIVLCGIKADLTNPTPEEPNKGFLIPNVTLTSVCSNKFQPGPPGEQAQVYSTIIMDLIKNSGFIDLSSLCIEEGKLAWCLFIEIICLSHDGNVLDACVLALMAALQSTKLPEVKIGVEENIEVTDTFIPLKIDDFVFPATFAVLNKGVVADPSAEEESLAVGNLTVFLKSDSSISVQLFGSIKPEQIFKCIECSKARYLEMKSLLQALN